MKIRDLYKALEIFDKDLEIVMASDAEGNSFCPLLDAEIANYLPNNTWDGDIIADEDLHEHDSLEIKKVICLWPTN